MQVLPRVQEYGSIVQLAERRSPKLRVSEHRTELAQVLSSVSSLSKTEGRGFKPFCSCKKNMEFVAQLVERQNVDLEVMGSSPIILPKCFNSSVGRAALL